MFFGAIYPAAYVLDGSVPAEGAIEFQAPGIEALGEVLGGELPGVGGRPRQRRRSSVPLAVVGTAAIRIRPLAIRGTGIVEISGVVDLALAGPEIEAIGTQTIQGAATFKSSPGELLGHGRLIQVERLPGGRLERTLRAEALILTPSVSVAASGSVRDAIDQAWIELQQDAVQDDEDALLALGVFDA